MGSNVPQQTFLHTVSNLELVSQEIKAYYFLYLFFFSPEHFSLVILFSISFVYRVIRYFGFLWTVLFYVPVGMVTHLTGIPFHFQKGPGLGHKLCDHPTNLSHFYTYYIFTRC